jgi:hypothetical protein
MCGLTQGPLSESRCDYLPSVEPLTYPSAMGRSLAW